jgi:hypothetical protein
MNTLKMKRREPFVGVGLLAFIVVACLTSAPVGAADLATNGRLAGQPYNNQDFAEQLGKPLCVTHDIKAATASYYFQPGNGASLKIVVNEARWAVDFWHVIAVHVATSALPVGCVGLTQRASFYGNTYQLVTDRGHVQLGDSLDHATQVLGDPESNIRHDGMVRLEYSWDRDLYKIDLWTLSFREGHLVEWTIRTLPVFYEVGG